MKLFLSCVSGAPTHGNSRRLALAVAGMALTLAALYTGCDNTNAKRSGAMPRDAQDRISKNLYPALHGTVGEYSALVDAAPTAVEGYGIVANLPGTGSGDMDPKIRELLLDQLLQNYAGSYANGMQDIDPDKILASNEIAVVEVHGVIPPLARKGTTFDLTINAMPGSQTVSLENGLLWTTELKQIATPGNETKTIAMGRGPVFIPAPLEAVVKVGGAEGGAAGGGTVPAVARSLRSGRVLGGGIAAEDRTIRLQLNTPSYRISHAIELAINARFPARDPIAIAGTTGVSFTTDSDAIISLTIPVEYYANPAAFIDLVKRLYLSTESLDFTEQKAAELIAGLQQPGTPHRDLSLALQGLGRSILDTHIRPQYTAADPEFRFWCARAGACMQDNGGKVVLQEMIKDPGNPFRMQAVDALVEASMGRDTAEASTTLYEMVNSANPDDRIVAYRGLLAMRSPLVQSYAVKSGFILDIVPSDGPPLIYATQAESPRIALIGLPLSLPVGAVYISPDRLLTIACNDTPAAADSGNGRVLTAASIGGNTAGAAKPAENVTLYWRSPMRDEPVNLKSVQSLPEMIARLAWLPDPRAADYDTKAPYIGASYQRVTEMLATLCRDDILRAKFVLQKAPAPLLTPAQLAHEARPEGSTMTPATTAPSALPAADQSLDAPPATLPAAPMTPANDGPAITH